MEQFQHHLLLSVLVSPMYSRDLLCSAFKKYIQSPLQLCWQQRKARQRQQQLKQQQQQQQGQGQAPSAQEINTASTGQLPSHLIQLSEVDNGDGPRPAAAEAAAAAAGREGGTTHQHSISVLSSGIAGGIAHPQGLAGSSHLAEGAADPKGNITAALMNYRTYVLAATYAMSFGAELAVNNILVKYLFEHFELDLATAGALGEAEGCKRVGGAAWGEAGGAR